MEFWFGFLKDVFAFIGVLVSGIFIATLISLFFDWIADNFGIKKAMKRINDLENEIENLKGLVVCKSNEDESEAESDDIDFVRPKEVEEK